VRNRPALNSRPDAARGDALRRIPDRNAFGDTSMLGTILIILLILILIGAIPNWGYSRGWGYYPSGGLGLLFIILLILVLTGRV
jgi:hypothetical protein